MRGLLVVCLLLLPQLDGCSLPGNPFDDDCDVGGEAAFFFQRCNDTCHTECRTSDGQRYEGCYFEDAWCAADCAACPK